MAPKINAGKSSDRNQVFDCPAHYNGHESTYGYMLVQVFLKGQLISKGLFDVIVATKKVTNVFEDFCPSL